MRRLFAALVAFAALAHADTAPAGVFSLLATNAPVDAPPPLPAGAGAQPGTTELRIPGHLASREFVAVGIGPDGVPVRVTATQRLVVNGTGDYSFLVPAPATSIQTGSGSDSAPGLRNTGIVWQGFSDRRRVLSATVALRPSVAAKGLPLQVRIERQGDSTLVHLKNATSRQVSVVTCCTTRTEVLTALAKLRATARRSPLITTPPDVEGEARKGREVDAAAPLRVTGAIAEGVTVDDVLGGRRPLERTFTLPGDATPALRLRVELLGLRELLPRRRELAHATGPLVVLQGALASAATTTAYERYLGSPDPVAPSEASYAYRSVPRAAVAKTSESNGSGDTLAILLGISLGAVGLAGLAVLWARS